MPSCHSYKQILYIFELPVFILKNKLIFMKAPPEIKIFTLSLSLSLSLSLPLPLSLLLSNSGSGFFSSGEE